MLLWISEGWGRFNWMTLLDWLIIIAGWVELLFDARLFLGGKNDAICHSLQMFWARILEGQSRPKGTPRV